MSAWLIPLIGGNAILLFGISCVLGSVVTDEPLTWKDMITVTWITAIALWVVSGLVWWLS